MNIEVIPRAIAAISTATYKTQVTGTTERSVAMKHTAVANWPDQGPIAFSSQNNFLWPLPSLQAQSQSAPIGVSLLDFPIPMHEFSNQTSSYDYKGANMKTESQYAQDWFLNLYL